MHSYKIYFYFVIVLSLSFSSAYFLGGTIHWMSLPSPEHAILFTYRLAWQKSTGPCGAGCDASIIGNHGNVTTPSLSNLTWQCSINCGSKWGPWDINYVLTSVSRSSDGWEQGEGSFQHIFNGTGPFKVWLKSFSWIPSGRSPVPEIGYLHTVVDLRKRNDINLPNSSPYVSLQSIIGVQLNCSTVIQLPVYDPDGDIVRCRWTEPDECDKACTNVPINTVLLNKVNCSLTINAYSFQGYTSNETYRLTIMVEDFPKKNITVGSVAKNKEISLSSIPVQLTLRIIDVSHECSSLMAFVRPSPRPLRVSYTNQKLSNSTLVRLAFFLETQDKRTTDFQVSAPAYANYTILDFDNSYGRPNVTTIQMEWLPKLSQIGDYQICVWGTDQHGLTSGARCVTEIVQDDYECPGPTGSCHGNGQCINLYKSEACNCNPGFKPPNCAIASRCLDSPCYHNATCLDSGKTYYCHCLEGYTGQHCEYEIDACDIKPCLNGGTCISLQKDYRCVCPKDFSGKSCERHLYVASTSMLTRISSMYSVSSPSTESSLSLSSTTSIPATSVVAVSKEDIPTTVFVPVSSALVSVYTSSDISASSSKTRNTTSITMSRPTTTASAMHSTPSPSTTLLTVSSILNVTRLSPILFKSASEIPKSSSTDRASKTVFTTVTNASTSSSTTNLSSTTSTFDSTTSLLRTQISSDGTTNSSFTLALTTRVSRTITNVNYSKNIPSSTLKFGITFDILKNSIFRSYDMGISSLKASILTTTTSEGVSSSSANILNGNIEEYTGDRKLLTMKIVAGVISGLVGLGILGACLWMVMHRLYWNRKKDEERSRKPSSAWLNAGQTNTIAMIPERQTTQQTGVWKNNRVDPDPDNSIPPPKLRKPDVARVRKESRVELLG